MSEAVCRRRDPTMVIIDANLALRLVARNSSGPMTSSNIGDSHAELGRHCLPRPSATTETTGWRTIGPAL
jgi:hypothetical protein